MNNDPTTWKVTLGEFDDPNAIWGRTIIINPLINTTSYFYANLPLYVRQSLRDEKGALDPEKLKAYFNNKAQQVINGIVYGYRVLNYIPFLNLMESIQLALRQGVYLAIDKLCANTFNEITESSSISTTNLTIDQDVTNWLTKSGFVGTSAYKKIQLSGIKNYELIWDYHGNLKEIIYNKKPLKINFKTGEILYDVEINTTNDDSLLTRKEITKLIPKVEEQPFKTGQYVSDSYLKSNSTIASQDNPIYTKEDVNEDIQEALKNKQDSLNDNNEHLIDKGTKSILHTTDWDNDLQKKFDAKLTTSNLANELQTRVTHGDNVTIVPTENGIQISATGGGGQGDEFWKVSSDERSVILKDAYLNLDMTGKSILNILGLTSFINSTENFDIFNKDNNSLVLQLGKNETNFYNSNRGKSYLKIKTKSDDTSIEFTDEDFGTFFKIDSITRRIYAIGNSFVLFSDATNDNGLISKKYVDDGLLSKQGQLTTGENITINDNIIESKPKNLYTDGLKSMSVIDVEQQFNSINDLLTKIKSLSGDRSSSYFQLFIQDQNNTNNRAFGYVRKHYTQIKEFYELSIEMLFDGTTDDWLWVADIANDFNGFISSSKFIFDENFNLKNWKGEFIAQNKSTIIKTPAWAGNLNTTNSNRFFLGCLDVWGSGNNFLNITFNVDEILRKLNNIKFTINLGMQIGYTNEN